MRGLSTFVSRLGAAVAALATVAIVLVVLTQVACRLLGVVTQGLDEVVAWLTAAACVAGFGYAFRHGAHVRVDLVTERLPSNWARASRLASLVAGLGMAGFAAYACVLMAVQSYAYGDVAQGMIALPLWLPQLSLALGTVSLAVALLEALVTELSGAVSVAVRRAAHGVADL